MDSEKIIINKERKKAERERRNLLKKADVKRPKLSSRISKTKKNESDKSKKTTDGNVNNNTEKICSPSCDSTVAARDNLIQVTKKLFSETENLITRDGFPNNVKVLRGLCYICANNLSSLSEGVKCKTCRRT
ncbi:hypothetical protein QE152_g15150 [Popillia japonica]|uniref:Uncharacterized protein n=1 Tax=Popillia japonica TaxID=7064 RepID=A0AAW1L7Z4_POPJA